MRDRTVGRRAKLADHDSSSRLLLPLPRLVLRSCPNPSEAIVLTDRGVGLYECPCQGQAELPVASETPIERAIAGVNLLVSGLSALV